MIASSSHVTVIFKRVSKRPLVDSPIVLTVRKVNLRSAGAATTRMSASSMVALGKLGVME